LPPNVGLFIFIARQRAGMLSEAFHGFTRVSAYNSMRVTLHYSFSANFNFLPNPLFT